MMIRPREREILRQVWQHGPLSRWELHQRIGQTPNAVGRVVRGLIGQGLLREGVPPRRGGGRPRVPLEIDPQAMHVIGLALAPGQVSAARLNLLGEPAAPAGRPARQDHHQPLTDPAGAAAAAARLLRRLINDRTIGVGLGVAGFIDPSSAEVLAGSAVAPAAPISLARALRAAGPVPVVLANDTQALAAQWMLTHRAGADEDVLLVHISEGSVSASLLVGGRPNRGCAGGASELGHTRFTVETEVCYCGHTGCLERICSGDFLRRQGARRGTMTEHVERYAGSGKPLETMIRYLAMGLANAANLVRPHRLVLAGRFVEHAPFTSRLIDETRRLLLVQIRQRMRVDCWDIAGTRTPEGAAWLALANLYYDGWSDGDRATT